MGFSLEIKQTLQPLELPYFKSCHCIWKIIAFVLFNDWFPNDCSKSDFFPSMSNTLDVGLGPFESVLSVR